MCAFCAEVRALWNSGQQQEALAELQYACPEAYWSMQMAFFAWAIDQPGGISWDDFKAWFDFNWLPYCGG
jgi:hypothetical protein